MEERTVLVDATQNGQAAPGTYRAGGLDPSSPVMQTLSLAARLVVGIVFLIAGAEKLTALDAFGHAIANYRMIPVSMVNIAALLFVWAEIVTGILLIAGIAVRGAALLSAALLGVFIVAILSAMARGLTIDCGCFVSAKDVAATAAGAPPAGEQVGWGKVLEDTALLAGSVLLIYFPKSYLMLERLLVRERKSA